MGTSALKGLGVTLAEQPSWAIKLRHASFPCTSVKLNFTWLMKRNSVKSTKLEAHHFLGGWGGWGVGGVGSALIIILKQNPFAVAK